MQRIVLYSALLGLLLGGCKKDREFPAPTFPVIEHTTKQTILIEPTVSVSCGICPLAHHEIEEIEAEHEDVIHMSHYLWGPLYHEYTSYLMEKIDKTVYTPLAHINRNHEDGSVVYYQWQSIRSLVEQKMAEGTDVGLSIDATTDADVVNLSVEASLEDASASRSMLVTVVLVEESIISSEQGYRQNNYGDEDPEHPFYMRGNPIPDFEHTNVIRQVLTAFEGDPLEIVDGAGAWTGTLDLSTIDESIESYSIIAFVNGTGSDVQPIQNAALLEL